MFIPYMIDTKRNVFKVNKSSMISYIIKNGVVYTLYPTDIKNKYQILNTYQIVSTYIKLRYMLGPDFYMNSKL